MLTYLLSVAPGMTRPEVNSAYPDRENREMYSTVNRSAACLVRAKWALNI